MVIVVPSIVTVPLSLVTTVVPLKVIVVVELSESLSSDSVVVVSVAESEALLVNTEAVSDAVATADSLRAAESSADPCSLNEAGFSGA